jgi:serine/threonine protein kinase
MPQFDQLVTALTGLRRTRFLIPQYKVLGAGASGVGIRVRDGRRIIEHIFAHHEVLESEFGTPLLPQGQPVVLKIVKPSPRSRIPAEMYAAEIEREVSTLRALASSQPTLLGNKTFDVRPYIPQFFASGYVADLGVWFIAMSHAPGKLLADMKYPMTPARLVARLEHAMLSMWLAGYAHTDLHGGNVLIDSPKRTVTIIDFGRAVRLSPKVVAAIRARIEGMSQRGLLSASLLETIGVPVNRYIQYVYKTNTAYSRYQYYLNGVRAARHTKGLCTRQPLCQPESLARERQLVWMP